MNTPFSKWIFCTFLILIGFTSKAQGVDSSQIIISSSNLSEDMNYSLTKDDELLLLIYEFNDSIKSLKSPVLVHRFNLNEHKKSDTINWVKPVSNNFLLFLIELDSDKTNFEIDPVVRVYFEEIQTCFTKRDYYCLEQYLGDEDLLGVKQLSTPTNLSFKGIHKLDKYVYSVSLK